MNNVLFELSYPHGTVGLVEHPLNEGSDNRFTLTHADGCIEGAYSAHGAWQLLGLALQRAEAQAKRL